MRNCCQSCIGENMANDEVDRRSEILNAAVECFGTLGYYGTSLQKIATMSA